MNRRTFNAVLASAAASSLAGALAGSLGGCATGAGSGGRRRTVLYQSVGDQLTHWDVDVDNAALTRRASIALPSNVQYVWPHPSRQYLYVSTSDAASGNAPNPGTVHRLCAVRVDAERRAAAARGAAGTASAPHPQQRGRHRRVRTHLLQQSEQRHRASHRRRRHGRRAGDPVDADRHGHLRAPGADHARQPVGDHGHTRQPPRGHQAGGPWRAEDLPLQGRPALAAGQSAGGRQGGARLRPSPPGLPPDAALGVRLRGIAEPAAHASPPGRQPDPQPAYNQSTTVGTYGIDFPQSAGGIHVHPNGRYCLRRQPGNATGSSMASACSAAARTTSPCFPSTRVPASRWWSSMPTLSPTTSAPSASTPAAGSWSRQASSTCSCARARHPPRARGALGVPHRGRWHPSVRPQVRRRTRLAISMVGGCVGLPAAG